MSYRDREWVCEDQSMLHRGAEVYTRMFIGFGWAFALMYCLLYLFPASDSVYPILAFTAILYIGVELALPPKKDDS